MIEGGVQHAVLTAIKNLRRSIAVNTASCTLASTIEDHRGELATKSVSASTDRGVGSFVLDPDQRDFSGNIEGLQLTVSSRKDSYTVLSRIDETRGYITVEGGDLLVNDRNFERKTHTRHPCNGECRCTVYWIEFFSFVGQVAG